MSRSDTDEDADGSGSSPENLQFLVVVAHPHDFTHCAATCGIHAENGDTVSVVAVTDGSYTHNEELHDELMKPPEERDEAVISQSRDQYAEEKAAEFERACDLFGVQDTKVLGYPQPFRVDVTRSVVEDLTNILLEVRPDVVITHRPNHPDPKGRASMEPNDHVEAAKAISEAKILAATPDYDSDTPPHTVATTYYMGGGHFWFGPDEIDVYVDISDWGAERKQAEAIFETQGHTEAFAERRIEVTSGHVGWSARTQFAEGFVRAESAVASQLTPTELELSRAREPKAKWVDRIEGNADSR